MTIPISLALPAQLKQALEKHRDQDDIADDAELIEIFSRLDVLNEKVAMYKQRIKHKRGGDY